MGLFDFFKKEEDVTINYNLYQMKKGFMVDYFMQSWEVKEVTVYDWGNNIFSREYLIDSGSDKQFLHVEEESGKLKCSLSKEANLTAIDPNIRSSIISNDTPIERITKDGKTFYRAQESIGQCVDEDEDDWSDLVNWMYLDEAEQEFVSVDRWGEQDITGAVGSFVKENEFSNILPR